MTPEQLKRQLSACIATYRNNEERIKAIEAEQATLRWLRVELRKMIMDATEARSHAA